MDTSNVFSGFLDGLLKALMGYLESFVVKLIGGLFGGGGE